MASNKRVSNDNKVGKELLVSVNPYNSEIIGRYESHHSEEIDLILKNLNSYWKVWKQKTFKERQAFLFALNSVLTQVAIELAEMVTSEMGKPLAESRAEIHKCKQLLQYYASLKDVFEPQTIQTSDGCETKVYNEPIGTILGIMPWNYPVWQVFRAAIPAILSGNVFVLKHAPNVSGTAGIIEEMFENVFEPNSVFASLRIPDPLVLKLIEHPLVAGVTFTGSTRTGRLVASHSAMQIKPQVLELGGSNAMIIDESGDISQAIQALVKSRFQNSGQSCLATKRVFIHRSIWDTCLEKLIQAAIELKVGDPSAGVDIGPLARVDLADNLSFQIKCLENLGYKSVLEPIRTENIFSPGIYMNDQQLFKDEIFGPVLLVYSFTNLEEAIEMSNASDYGLGVSIFMKEEAWLQDNWQAFGEGNIALNDFVKSYPEIPFGGIKESGYGAELGVDGLFSFTHKKTVRIRR